MRLVMAASYDRFLCKGPDDRMDWTGPIDKAVFRILTGVGGNLAVGSGSAPYMPVRLKGRELKVLSRDGYGLCDFQLQHPDGWLVGGPTVAREAVRLRLVSEAHIVYCGAVLGEGVSALPLLEALTQQMGQPRLSTPLGNVTVEAYRRGP